MPGLGIPPEKARERLAEVSSKKRIRNIYQDPSVKDIPFEHLVAVIGLSGGEAYLDDIKWILERLFNYKIKHDLDLFNLLEDYGFEWDINEDGEIYWKLNEKFVKKYEESVKRAMEKALGYRSVYAILRSLFNEKDEREMRVWEKYKD